MALDLESVKKKKQSYHRTIVSLTDEDFQYIKMKDLSLTKIVRFAINKFRENDALKQKEVKDEE